MVAVRRHLVSAAAVLFVSLAIFAEQPTLDVGSDGVVAKDLSPGQRVAWMAFTRERIGWRGMSRIRYGTGVAGADGTLHVPHPVPTAPFIIWNVADLAAGRGAHATAKGMPVSNKPVRIAAPPGSQAMVIDAGQVHLLYVSPPAGAWATTAADGGGGDADGRQDGHITIPLASLHVLNGNRKAPDTLGRGDLILVVDPIQLRTGQVVVP